VLVGRLLFLFFVFALPFIVFALYLFAIRRAEEKGRRTWPISLLTAIGIGLVLIVALVMILTHPRERGMCQEPARVENGLVIPARTYPCEQRLQDVGVPRAREPAAPQTQDDPD
jgi:uncharacterized membrane protein